VEQKGLTYLLDACALLRDRNFPFTCEVIGGTEEPLYAEYWERLKEQHHRLDLETQVFFRGAQPFARVMEAYRAADVFVLPCVVAQDGRRDITPNAVIEAMAMKLPVVSTPVTGVVEIVEHGTSGLLVPPEDPVALADEIERLARDRALATTLGENARLRIENRFDADKNVLARLGLFGTAPAKTPGSSRGQLRVSWQES
jgi:glycosyltransferase involved in cell wall biosynthesis